MDMSSYSQSTSGLAVPTSTISTPRSTSTSPLASSAALSQPPTALASTSTNGFQLPPHYSFPPFFTLQPNLTTLARQLALWSTLIQSYCAHNHVFRLSLSTAASSPLFNNAAINRKLDIISIRRVLDYMISAEGDRRAEWVPTGKKRDVGNEGKSSAWIYWKRPEEWADVIHEWVDSTGQKGSVLTIYELRESDAVQSQDWVGMDEEMFRKCLDALVRRGKAQVFGTDDGAGVKFF